MFKGNNQKIWFDGDLVATLTKAECKLALEYEDVNCCGSDETDYEYTGFKITGTLTKKKVNSNILAKMNDAMKQGTVPEFTITGANMQIDGQTERVNLFGVKITELQLLNAEAKKTADEEIPFNARNWELAERVV